MLFILFIFLQVNCVNSFANPVLKSCTELLVEASNPRRSSFLSDVSFADGSSKAYVDEQARLDFIDFLTRLQSLKNLYEEYLSTSSSEKISTLVNSDNYTKLTQWIAFFDDIKSLNHPEVIGFLEHYSDVRDASEILSDPSSDIELIELARQEAKIHSSEMSSSIRRIEASIDLSISNFYRFWFSKNKNPLRIRVHRNSAGDGSAAAFLVQIIDSMSKKSGRLKTGSLADHFGFLIESNVTYFENSGNQVPFPGMKKFVSEADFVIGENGQVSTDALRVFYLLEGVVKIRFADTKDNRLTRAIRHCRCLARGRE